MPKKVKEGKIEKTKDKVDKKVDKKIDKKTNEKIAKKANKKKVDIKNYRSTSRKVIATIYWFRILAIIFVIIAPIVFTLAISYDDGIVALTNFTISNIPWFSTLNRVYVNVRIWLPILLWIAYSLWFFLWFFLPFMKRKSTTGRSWLAARFIIWPIIFIGIIWALEYTIVYFPHHTWEPSPGEIIHSDNNASYYKDLTEYFNPLSSWMIFLQIFHLIVFAYGILVCWEVILMKKEKLSFSDLLINPNDHNSVASLVLSERLSFGEFVNKKELNAKIKKEKKLTIQMKKN